MNSPVTTQETVFVVDDDEAVRDSLRWLLEANGYRVQCFSSAEQFIDAWQPHQHPGQIACLILDVRMSGMSGLELQERLIADNASLPIIFVTGHGDVPMAVSTMKKGAMDFIEKPFDEAELRKHQRAAAARGRRAARQAHRARASGAGAHHRGPPEQADRRRPRHQHQDGRGASREHHGKAQRQHGRRSAATRAVE
jgi:FixJ family two-component response regulator